MQGTDLDVPLTCKSFIDPSSDAQYNRGDSERIMYHGNKFEEEV